MLNLLQAPSNLATQLNALLGEEYLVKSEDLSISISESGISLSFSIFYPEEEYFAGELSATFNPSSKTLLSTSEGSISKVSPKTLYISLEDKSSGYTSKSYLENVEEPLKAIAEEITSLL